MKRFMMPLAILICIYLDSLFFNMYNIAGIRPDALLALIASLGLLLGSVKGGILGLCLGLFMDLFFNKYLGLTAIAYMLAGAVGGIFFQKFYADNVIIPSAVAGVFALAKEHILAFAMFASGVRFSYATVLLTYILPCALFSAALCIPLHLWMKKALARQIKTERHQSKPRQTKHRAARQNRNVGIG